MKVVMSIDASDESLFHGINITTENFEEIYVGSSYISSIEVTSAGLTSSEYEKVIVKFNSDFIQEKDAAIKRLQERADITYIDILCKHGSNIEIAVPYEDDENGFNQLQGMINYGDGIMLNIQKKGGLLQ